MKCINCGKELQEDNKICDNCGVDQEHVEIIKEEKKSNNLLFIIITIVLLIVLGLGTWFLINNINSKKEENNEKIAYDEEKEILINNYILTIPDGFVTDETDTSNYIKNKNYMILYDEYPLNYEQIMENKIVLIKELENQGYTIDQFDEHSDNKYITIKGKMNNIEYGFVFYEIDEKTNVFLTIVSNHVSSFNAKWFDSAIAFLKTARKVK